MKKIIVTIGIAVTIMACHSKKETYVIKGAISGVDSGKIIISNFSEDATIADTTDIQNGQFIFTGSVTAPEFFTLYVEDQPGSLTFLLVNDKITITGDVSALQEAVVTGPPMVAEANVLLARRDSILTVARGNFQPEFFEEMENDSTPAARKAEIQALYEQAIARIQAAAAVVQQLYADYVKAHPTSPLSLLLAVSIIDKYTTDELSAMWEAMSVAPALQGNRFLEIIKEYATMPAATVAVGQVAPDFTQNDPDGNPVLFSTIYKKHTLTMIDFWASWCGPCREFNPTLVKLYKKYHPKGLEIVGVSFDGDRESWLKAIAADGLIWPQVSNLQGRQNTVGRLYRIGFIPQNIFVNADGVVLAMQVEGENLDAFLKEQLNGKN
ncbi:MAG: AhpC/TSA family protein [Prevotellaceae bacterium]|jgi:thiol-disulfide isomerase/thioredoxin|nr:AhpC/TSA family protein [Prevotellaceae bacterium]